MYFQPHSLLALLAGMANPSDTGALQEYFSSGSMGSRGFMDMLYLPLTAESLVSSKVMLAQDQLKEMAALPAANTLLFFPPL